MEEFCLTRLVGRGHAEVLLRGELALPRPAAVILDGRKTVLIDRVDILPGCVLLQGRLRVTWTYQVAELPDGGPVWAATAELPIAQQVPVAGAEPGMAARVVDAYVSADASELLHAGALRDCSVVLLSVEVTAQNASSPAAGSQAGLPSVVIGRFGGRRATP